MTLTKVAVEGSVDRRCIIGWLMCGFSTLLAASSVTEIVEGNTCYECSLFSKFSGSY
jgi:hypothetical protein